MRILILEDDPIIADDLQAILEGEGHEIVGAFASTIAAQAHLEDRVDCALLDIDVIGGKSYGVAAELMERGIPFAFVSASQRAELPASLRQVPFIAKPYREGAILQFVGRTTSMALTCH